MVTTMELTAATAQLDGADLQSSLPPRYPLSNPFDFSESWPAIFGGPQ
jgi:hypothetical protein